MQFIFKITLSYNSVSSKTFIESASHLTSQPDIKEAPNQMDSTRGAPVGHICGMSTFKRYCKTQAEGYTCVICVNLPTSLPPSLQGFESIEKVNTRSNVMENFAQDHKAKYPTDNTNAQELMLHPILRCILQMINFHLRESNPNSPIFI